MKSPLLPSVLFLVLGLSAASAQSPAPPTIASASGQARVYNPGAAEPVLAAAGMEIAPGAELRTGDNGEITLILFPRLAITVKSGSRLRLEERNLPQAADADTVPYSALVHLPEGRVVVLISNPPAGQASREIDLRIRTPQGIARPRGTFYAVLVKEGKSYLAVREGMVGLEQFQPLETEDPAAREKLPVRNYGASTTTSPRG